MNKPPILVVSIFYNNFDTVLTTIRSVKGQLDPCDRYIVIDRGSTDGTQTLITSELGISKYVILDELSIKEAFKLTFDMVDVGNIIFVNNGDYLYDNRALGDIRKHIEVINHFDLLCCRQKTLKSDGTINDYKAQFEFDSTRSLPVTSLAGIVINSAFLHVIEYNDHEDLSSFLMTGVNAKASVKNFDRVVSITNYKDRLTLLADYKKSLKLSDKFSLKNRIKLVLYYLLILIYNSPLKVLFVIMRSFIIEYLPNHVINKIPFYVVRHTYYKKILGIKIMPFASVHMNCFITGSNIFIGENTVINRNCFLDGRGKLHIGKNVSVSPDVHMITGDHDMNLPNFPFRGRDLIIEDQVWIGTRATILPGLTIGKGAVICAGAVVSRSVEPYKVVAGVPARVINQRNVEVSYNPSWMPWFN